MMLKLPDDPLVIITFVLAIGGNLVWSILFFTNSIKRKFAAERDFGHVKNNLKGLTDNLDILFRELDRRLDSQDKDLLEIKAYLIGRGLMNRSDEEKLNDS